jgi:hypothetical protein
MTPLVFHEEEALFISRFVWFPETDSLDFNLCMVSRGINPKK